MGVIVGSVCHFGLSISSEIFQKHLQQESNGLAGVYCITNNIIIYGASNADHDNNLEGLMQRCQEKGIKLNSEKLELKSKESCIPWSPADY